MTKMMALIGIVGTAMFLTLTPGCATKETENTLRSAGFKAVPATTAAQEAHLKTLPAHKVTMVHRAGKDYYIYPDPRHNVLYIGQKAQYERYQQLYEAKLKDREQLDMVSVDANWDCWGPGTWEQH